MHIHNSTVIAIFLISKDQTIPITTAKYTNNLLILPWGCTIVFSNTDVSISIM